LELLQFNNSNDHISSRHLPHRVTDWGRTGTSGCGLHKNDLLSQFVNDFGCGRWMDHMEICYSFKVSGFDGKRVCAAAEVTWV